MSDVEILRWVLAVIGVVLVFLLYWFGRADKKVYHEHRKNYQFNKDSEPYLSPESFKLDLDENEIRELSGQVNDNKTKQIFENVDAFYDKVINEQSDANDEVAPLPDIARFNGKMEKQETQTQDELNKSVTVPHWLQSKSGDSENKSSPNTDPEIPALEDKPVNQSGSAATTDKLDTIALFKTDSNKVPENTEASTDAGNNGKSAAQSDKPAQQPASSADSRQNQTGPLTDKKSGVNEQKTDAPLADLKSENQSPAVKPVIGKNTIQTESYDQVISYNDSGKARLDSLDGTARDTAYPEGLVARVENQDVDQNVDPNIDKVPEQKPVMVKNSETRNPQPQDQTTQEQTNDSLNSSDQGKAGSTPDKDQAAAGLSGHKPSVADSNKIRNTGQKTNDGIPSVKRIVEPQKSSLKPAPRVANTNPVIGSKKNLDEEKFNLSFYLVAGDKGKFTVSDIVNVAQETGLTLVSDDRFELLQMIGGEPEPIFSVQCKDRNCVFESDNSSEKNTSTLVFNVSSRYNGLSRLHMLDSMIRVARNMEAVLKGKLYDIAGCQITDLMITHLRRQMQEHDTKYRH